LFDLETLSSDIESNPMTERTFTLGMHVVTQNRHVESLIALTQFGGGAEYPRGRAK
jgi:hypothetical protein